MRIILCIIFLFGLNSAFAQMGYNSDYVYAENYEFNESDYKRKYPYVKGYAPSFVGLIAGYSFLKTKEVEIGVSYNFMEGLTDFGMTAGYQLLYRRSIERSQNAVDLEMGMYGVISMGIGMNYNFSNDGSAFGFKPFVGTSIYHFQFLYGYNFLRKKKQEWYQLSRHSLSIRYLIPLKASKQSYYYLPPAPNYQNLPGLHKKHPVKNNNTRRDIQLR